MEFYEEVMMDYSGSCSCDDDCGSHGSGCDDADTCDDYCAAD